MKKPFPKLFSPNVPFSPSKWHFHYGWVIAALSVIVMMASIPGQTVGVGLFTDFLLEKLPFTRVELAFCYMLATGISATLLPLVGKLIDRWGERIFAVLASILAGSSLLMMYILSEHIVRFLVQPEFNFPLQHSLIPLRDYLVLVGAMVVVFFLLRFSSQGILAIVSRNLLGKWFITRRSRMATLTGFFVSFGFAGAPFLLNLFMEKQSVSFVLLWLFGILAVGFACFFYVFVRNTPEECDLLPDTRVKTPNPRVSEPYFSPSEATRPDEREPQGISLSDAIRTPVFWLFSSAITLQGILITGFSFHITSIGALSGYSRQEMYSFFPLISLAAICSQAVFGFWSEKKDIRVSYFGLLVCIFVSGFGMLQMQFLAGLITTFVSLGISIGNFNLISTVGFAMYFGRTHLGAIQGFHLRNVIIGTAIAPWLFAWTFKLFGNYVFIILLIVVLSVFVLFGAFRLRAPAQEI